MNDTPQKKKMSTGCLVGIIVFSGLLLVIIALAFYCYANREKLVAMGATKVVQEVKNAIATDPQPGVDTVQVNAVADQLLEHIKSTEKLNLEKVGQFMSGLGQVFDDEKIDSTEVAAFFRAAEDFDPAVVIPQSTPPMMEDTTGAAMDTSGME